MSKKLQSKKLSSKFTVSEDSCCVLCLKPAVAHKPSNKRLKKKVKYLYYVCCRVLNIDKDDPINNLRKKMSFCMSCLCILKECDALYEKLEEIQKSIKKIEIDTKSTIIKSQQFLAKSLKNDANSDDYQQFRYIAIKDFKLEVNSYSDVPNPHPTPACKTYPMSLGRSGSDQNHVVSRQEDCNEENDPNLFDDDYDGVEIKEEYNIYDQNSSNEDGGDWQNEMDNDDQISFDNGNNEIDPQESQSNTVLTEGENVESENQKKDIKDDCDSESDIKKRKSDESDPEYSKSCSSDSDEDYVPSSTKKRKASTKSQPKKSVEKKPPAPSKCPVNSDGTIKPKRKGNNPYGRRNQLDGVEIKIGEKRWSYRSIEYFYNDEKQAYECGLCGNTKSLQKKIRCHIGTFHGVEGFGKWLYKGVKYSFDKERNRFICSVCNKDFSTRNTVGRHINFAHVVEIENGKRLNQSGKEYKQVKLKDVPDLLEPGKWKYKAVEFTKDESTGLYTCHLCSRIRKTWHSIILHIRESHNDDNSKLKNQCPECGSTFGTSYRLKAHLITHSEHKSYQCEECGEVFRHRGSLYGHVQRIHEKKRPYICEYCSKSFFTRKDCYVHVRTHTKERPYVCEFQGCGSAFAIRATLKAHQKSKNHHVSSRNETTAVENSVFVPIE